MKQIIFILILTIFLSNLIAAQDFTLKEISVGELFSQDLEENPTTGYGWQVENSDENVVSISDEYESSCGDEEIEGCGGIRTFTFTGLSPGETTIRLTHCRSWQCEETTLETKEILVTVKKDTKQCFIGGCSSQVCSSEPGIITTCEWLLEYGCLKDCKLRNNECSFDPVFQQECENCIENCETDECYQNCYAGTVEPEPVKENFIVKFFKSIGCFFTRLFGGQC